MKKILLIGKRGFLGNSLNKFLRKKFSLRFISFIEVKKISKSLINYDYIINTSINKNYINKKYNKKYDNDLQISDYINPKKLKIIKHNFSKNQSFYLNNKKLMSKIKIKNNLLQLKKDCLNLSKKLFN